VEKDQERMPSRREIFGLAVHHAVRARYSIERGRGWQAELWISATRDLALELSCLRRGLDASYGRELDKLPDDVLAAFQDTLVRSPGRGELLRALGCTVAVLLREAADVEAAPWVQCELSELVRAESL
jgi:hypothetical protein